MKATIAIIEPVFLTATGLKQCLHNMLPTVDVIIYHNIEQCKHDIQRADGTRPYFVHFFVNAGLLTAERDFFIKQPQTTIALTGHNPLQKSVNGFPAIDINADEQHIWRQLLDLRNNRNHPIAEILSKREIDVLRCIAQGMLNKEIADQLCISLNTVITHRQHITQKTRLHSVAELTVYAILNGYYKPE